jgi:hypothetical protein
MIIFRVFRLRRQGALIAALKAKRCAVLPEDFATARAFKLRPVGV